MDYPFFFTWSAQHAVKPIELTGGDGAWFTTSDGGRWADLWLPIAHACGAAPGGTR